MKKILILIIAISSFMFLKEHKDSISFIYGVYIYDKGTYIIDREDSIKVADYYCEDLIIENESLVRFGAVKLAHKEKGKWVLSKVAGLQGDTYNSTSISKSHIVLIDSVSINHDWLVRGFALHGYDSELESHLFTLYINKDSVEVVKHIDNISLPLVFLDNYFEQSNRLSKEHTFSIWDLATSESFPVESFKIGGIYPDGYLSQHPYHIDSLSNVYFDKRHIRDEGVDSLSVLKIFYDFQTFNHLAHVQKKNYRTGDTREILTIQLPKNTSSDIYRHRLLDNKVFIGTQSSIIEYTDGSGLEVFKVKNRHEKLLDFYPYKKK